MTLAITFLCFAMALIMWDQWRCQRSIRRNNEQHHGTLLYIQNHEERIQGLEDPEMAELRAQVLEGMSSGTISPDSELYQEYLKKKRSQRGA